jgi:hypothetical protein
MKLYVVALVTLGLMCGVASTALAQDALPRAGSATGGDESGVVYKKETVYDFEDDFVEGALVKPDGSMLSGELHGKMSSLIKVRSDFIPEMIKSVEDL